MKKALGIGSKNKVVKNFPAQSNNAASEQTQASDDIEYGSLKETVPEHEKKQ
ncbi:MAG TPA: hypothetical protein PLI65_10605 [Bacteroidales bacterium]|nr:hypothetical protein [Bacteroidales bacterium]